MIITETDITFNGIPLERLSTEDMLHFAKFMHIDVPKVEE